MVPVWARYLSIKLLEYRKGRLLSLSVSVSAFFDLLLCAIGAVSLLRSRKLKNDPAGLRKWGRFCAVDRGIGYRLAEQCLCSNRPPPPSCISCPSVCRWWICCVEKRWNNSLFQRLPGADLRHKRFSSKQREPSDPRTGQRGRCFIDQETSTPNSNRPRSGGWGQLARDLGPLFHHQRLFLMHPSQGFLCRAAPSAP